MRIIKRIILGLIATAFCASTCFAEDVLLYSYTKTGVKPAEWALVPTMAELDNTDPATLFEALKKRKLPTYGSTSLDTEKNTIQIDPEKCAYGSIISGEISHTFGLYQHKQPKYICGKEEIPSADSKLMYYTGIVPLWQAVSAEKTIQSPNLVQIGNEVISASDFAARLSKKDKKLAAAIEAGFNDPNTFVKSALMKGYIAKKFPNAEKRVAKELNSKSTSSVNSAMAALAQTKDAAIIKSMSAILNSPGTYQEPYALSMMDAGDQSLKDSATLILLKSSNDSSFNKAREIIIKDKNSSFLKNHLEEILPVATPSHAEILAQMVIESSDAVQLMDYLNKARGDNETAQTLAVSLLTYAKDTTHEIPDDTRAAMKRAAWGIQLASDDSTVAYDALDDLRKNDVARNAPSIWIRGLESKFDGIKMSSAVHLEMVEGLSSDEKSQLISGFAKQDNAIQTYLPEATMALASSVEDPKNVLKTAKTFIEKRSAYLAMQGDDIELTKSVSNAIVDGARLMSIVKNNHPDRMTQITSQAYHDSPTMRRDIAYCTRWLNSSADSLRTTILRDSDETVVQTLLRQFPKRPKEEISNAMVKEITARAERSSALKIAVLNILPFLMNEKTNLTVTTYASNEMFDSDIQVRIASIRALSEIAVRTNDPIVADNAINSLALTVQDQSDEIVHHTLVALAKTRNPAVADIIARAMKTHPKSAQRALEIYPFLN